MALVGDIIITARELMPDRCGTLTAPSGFSAVQLAAVPTLAAGTYVVQVSLLTSWGETLTTALPSVTVDGTHGIQVTGTLPAGAAKIRVYYGITTVNQYQDSATTPVSITAPGIAGVPPATTGGTPINRAYLPDSDGSFISAATIYRWLNQGLDEATDISGGIQDRTGIASSVGVALYTIPVVGWKKITNIWYDGYDVFPGSKRDIFRRNVTNAYSTMSVTVTLTPNSIIEAFPQPQRSGGTTTTNGSLSTAATSVAINAQQFVLPFGVASITQGTATEIVFYSSLSNNTMSGMTRGLGGTVPQAFTTGATVTELNFLIDGFRRAVLANVGDAGKIIQIPPAWASHLPRYILAQFREAEKEFQQAEALKKDFREAIRAEAAANKQLNGPIQIGSSNRGVEVYGYGPFGVIVP